MFFNSLDFAIFLPVVFVLYWLLGRRGVRPQNFFIVIASYIFYGWWDWRFLALILFSTIVDFFVAKFISQNISKIKKKTLLWVSILVNLGFLGVFKYYNFFLDNLISSFSFFGMDITGESLSIVLPVGISFYTFQTLSYTIDVYRNKLKPTSDFIAFMAFVCFFPQLVAGPIERATNLLPQFFSKREFNYHKAIDGLRQILWGLFKKVVIADNCAEYANLIFNNSSEYSGSTLLLGAFFFSFQIYCDFSGYSDIAIGTSRLFGFNLKKNFAFPYFSRDIAEFWRRWHISLSTWFRDYLYIPIGGSKGGILKTIRNIFIIFIVSGFWHGANWTFIIWGAINAIYFLPLFVMGKNRNNIDIVAQGKSFPSLKEFASMIFTFGLTLFAWIFFRAENLNHALEYISEIFSFSFFTMLEITISKDLYILIVLLLAFIFIEWKGRASEYALENFLMKTAKWGRLLFYYFIIGILFYCSGSGQDFIYFQF